MSSGNFIFKRESLREVWPELAPLFVKHYDEIAHYKDIALEPDEEMYFKLDDMGMFRAYIARDDAGKVAGYAGYFIKANIHYKSSVQAVQDVLYIDEARRGFGRRFIAWCDDELRKESVQVVIHHLKAAHNWGVILERMGYELQDLIYTKRLDKES